MLPPDAVRERYLAVKAELGPGVTVVAATKYVALEDMSVLAEAGVEVVGENRAQDLAAKHGEYGDAFRWHFIGHLQSNKAVLVNGICELVHSLDSESAARRLTVPVLVEVNLSGEPTKAGVEPGELEAFLALAGDVRGLMTMPPETGRSRVLAPVLPAPARARRASRPGRALDGHLAGLPDRGGGRRDSRASRLFALPPVGTSAVPRGRSRAWPGGSPTFDILEGREGGGSWGNHGFTHVI